MNDLKLTNSEQNDEYRDEDTYIEIQHSEAYYQTAKELSDYIHSLNISNAENDKLIELIFTHVMTTSHDSFKQGLKLGLEGYDE
ncbi:MAG: hypothetical protein UIM53_05295 [Acutalibacteraceae bacterium]|nr:hypothetical protein [Acutalibacteraceae bacterium]